MIRFCCALVASLAFLAPLSAAEKKEPLTLVVMDPLAADLSCPCVKGYAQRDYKKLTAFLEKQLGRTVKLHFAETLTVALTKKTAGKADIILGKDSVVRAGAKENKRDIVHVAALTDQKGVTTQTGLWVVAGKDKALLVSDLKGYTLYFGPADCDEKHAAAIALLKDFEITVPTKKDTCPSCTTAATKVVDGFKNDKKVAAIISSYARPLLEGCGTVKKGDLKVIGETDPVPFIAAFVSAKLSKADQAAIQKALLAVGKDATLCKAMETKKGFLTPEEAKKVGAKKK